MNKRMLVMATLISFILTFFFVGSTQAAKPIKIGVVYPFSGATAMLCESILKGYKIAAEEINKAGGVLGRPIELIVRDDGGNPEHTTRYCRELIIREEVDWMFAGHGHIPTMAALAVAKQFKKPIFLFGGHATNITTEDWNFYTFSFAVRTTAEGRWCAKILKEDVLKGVENPSLFWVSWEYEYGRSLYRPFMAKIKELAPNVKIVGEAWPRIGETDYGPFISHILAAKPTVIVNAIWGGGIAPLLKQCQQMGVFERSQLISMALVGSIEYRKLIGMDMPEGTWSNTYDDAVWPDNAEQRKFYQKYRDFVGNQEAMVPSHAAPGYYQMYLVAAAIKKAGTTEAKASIKAMEGISIDTYWGPLKVRDFDHQVLWGNIWAPMVKKAGKAYLSFDATRARHLDLETEIFTKEEWLAKRKAAGK